MKTAFYLIFLFLSVSAQGQVGKYDVDILLGKTLYDPADINTDSKGNIYVADNFNIRVFDGKGNFLKEINPDITDRLWATSTGVTLDKQDNVYVLTRHNGRIRKFNDKGELLLSFGETGTAPGQLKNPNGIAISPDGNIYIADMENHRVQTYDSYGRFVGMFGSYGDEPGQFTKPYQLTIDAVGNIFVADENRVQKFSPDHTLAFTIDTPSRPTDVSLDHDGNIYISLAERSLLKKYDSNGQFIEDIGEAGEEDGKMAGSIKRVAVDGSGNIIILETGLYFAGSNSKNRIQKFDRQGQHIVSFGHYHHDGDSLYGSHRTIAIDAVGNFFVAENDTRVIRKFDRHGRFNRKIGGSGNRPGSISSALISDITVSPGNELYVLTYSDKETIYKYSATGDFLYTITPQQTGAIFQGLNSITADYYNNIYLTYETHVTKIDQNGRVIGKIFLKDDRRAGNLTYFYKTKVDKQGSLYVIHDYHIKKYDQEGNLLLKFGSYGDGNTNFKEIKDMAMDFAGNLYVADRFTIKIFDSSGQFKGTVIENSKLVGSNMDITPDGARVVICNAMENGLVIGLVSSATKSVQHYITGKVYSDVDSNCRQGATEAGIAGILIEALPGPYYGITDNTGNYEIDLNPGSYTLRQVIPAESGRKIVPTCPQNTNTVVVTEPDRIVAGINFGNQVTLSPYLSVSVSSNRRRRCFESTTKLTYSNTGFAAANNVKIYLQLPAQVELLSSDKPYTRLPNGTYVFAAGTVAAGQRSVITIQDKVVCGDETIRGMTVCTRAWITPGNQNPTAPPAPVITITGTCNPETGKVRFVIKNAGQVDMEESEQFRKYINGLLSTVEDYRLAAGDSLVLWVLAGGRTVRLEADQPDGNGDNTMASTTIEACTAGANTTAFSSGFVNALPTDDEEAEVAEECLPIIDSFDPNDKLVTPTGQTEENYTPTGVALKYKIRFQNTGTDVAYRVVVVDTLSEHLDLSTLQIGSASHTYRYELSGKGKPVLTWTFDNIMLPDSTTNEPGSHGYIQFSIKPKADLPEKTAVENYGDIFFDYNSPVRTNVTVNRIYDMPLLIDEAVRLNLEQIIATPAILSFAPAAGKYGTEVSLSGKRFSATAARNKVYFNGILAPVVSASETELRVLVPASAATGAVRVVTPDGAANTADAFEVYQPPVLSSFSPAEGIAGSTVTLQGEQLNPDMLESIILGIKECDIISHTGNVLVVRVPSEAVTSKFEIITKGGVTESTTEYVVWHQPSISALSKSTAAVGATINLAGAHFAPAPERNRVMFGNVQAQVLNATTAQLTVKIPVGAASGFVTVETPGGKATSADSFEVIPAPVFVSMAPAKGSVGTEVEITGTHFGVLGVQDEIHFNGQKALVLEASDARYKVRVPRGASSGKVTITGYGGVAFSTTDFVVEELTPTQAIAVYPNPTTGHFTISFQHADFDVQAVQVFSTVGKLIHSAAFSIPRPDKLEMNLAFAQAGLYILQIRTDRGMVMKKLTVL